MSFDTKCYDLAVAFLPEEAPLENKLVERRAELAQVIQDTIEDYLRHIGAENG